jgi:hypothetical protein
LDHSYKFVGRLGGLPKKQDDQAKSSDDGEKKTNRMKEWVWKTTAFMIQFQLFVEY